MKIKRLVITAILALSIGSVSANAHNAFLEGKYVNISSVEFKTDAGVIDTLPDSGAVTVSVKAKKATQAAAIQPVTLVIAKYNGEKLIGVMTESFDIFDSYTKPLEATVSDVSGVTSLRVFVCDSLDSACPFGAKAIFAANKADVKGITVAGEEVENFSPDVTSYEVTVSAGHISFPEITPRLSDSGIRCEIETQGDFPLGAKGTATAVIKVGKNLEKTYTITLSQEQPEVSELIVVDGTASGEDVIDTTARVIVGVPDVEFLTEPAEPIKLSQNVATGEDMTEGYGTANVSGGVPIFSDRPYPMGFVPEAIKKAHYIQTKNGFHGRAGSRIEFNINRSATVYAAVSAPAELLAAGYEKANNMTISYINYSSVDSANLARLYKFDLYKKRFDVPVGETVSVSVPHGAVNAFVVFDETAPVKNATLTDRNGNITQLPLIDVRDAEEIDWKHPDYVENGNNYIFATRFITDQESKICLSTDFPDELNGTVGIGVPYNTTRQNPRPTGDFISFGLTETADVYFAYDAPVEDMPWLEVAGFVDVSDTIEPITYVHDESNTEQISTIYKATYNVLPGETVKVNIGRLPTLRNKIMSPMIFIKKHN